MDGTSGYVLRVLLRGAKRLPLMGDEEWRVETRRRWARLTADLHEFARETAEETPPHLDTAEAADVPEPNASEGEPSEQGPLDAPPNDLQKMLVPLRSRLLETVKERLMAYDNYRICPRPQDALHECRDYYEVYLRGEAFREVHAAIVRHVSEKALSSTAAAGSVAEDALFGRRWKVVGGIGKGGILVRRGCSTASEDVGERLSPGSVIRELELCRDRLRYELICGTGPAIGWVSTRVRVGEADKPLLSPMDGEHHSAFPPIVILGLMAAHISTEDRLQRLKHVLGSVRRQDLFPLGGVHFFFVLSWSAANPELDSTLQAAIDEVNEQPGPGPKVVTVRQTTRHSQFQHLKAALAAGEALLREKRGSLQNQRGECSYWALFGDDDDLWHHRRVKEYAMAIRAHPVLDGVAVFATTARVNVAQNQRVTDAEMPVSEADVEKFLASGQGERMDRDPICSAWRVERKGQGANAFLLPVPENLGTEYFDFCPRLRLVQDFFSRTPPELLEHRYCDLRFNEFMVSYPRMGCELGLEVSFFDPPCWMLFYSTPIPDAQQWETSVEKVAEEGEGDRAPKRINVNNGHMSSSLAVGLAEVELATRICGEFKEYEASMTPSKLARYWAAFRNTMEIRLVKKYLQKIDQRMFDLYVFHAINSSFFRFADLLNHMPDQSKAERAARMMYYVGQGFAKAVAVNFRVSVLWVKPNIFIGRDVHYSALGMQVPLLSASHK